MQAPPFLLTTPVALILLDVSRQRAARRQTAKALVQPAQLVASAAFCADVVAAALVQADYHGSGLCFWPKPAPQKSLGCSKRTKFATQLSLDCISGLRCNRAMPPVNRNEPKRAPSSESEMSLVEFMREFPDDATCLKWLWRNRYSKDGEHAHCPKCKETTAFTRYETTQQRQSWTCNACGHHMHPTAGTIFHKSSTSLHLWFYAMYLMTSTRCGISAKQIERELGVTYKTAWRMAHLIRHKLMMQDSGPFNGRTPVEIDETYVGGARRNTRRGRPGIASPHKTAVFGMVQRQGRVVAVTVPNVQRATVMPHIIERVLPKSTIYTDEFSVYAPLNKLGYRHHRVNHAEKVYVSGDVHTNSMEGFWSLVKRGIGGVYHSVSTKHLQGYLNEYAWRYNLRDDPKAKFQTLLLRALA